MAHWPDDDESLITQYIEQLGYKYVAAYRSWLRPFQRFVREHSPHNGLTERVFRTWIRKRAKESPRSFVLSQTGFIKGFLDWLMKQSVLGSHPKSLLTLINEDEVQQALANRGEDRAGNKDSRIAIGQTDAGRYLRVVYVRDPKPEDSAFVITAYEIQGKPLKAYRRRIGKK